MKRYGRLIIIALMLLVLYYFLDPGNRYLLLRYNSGNGYGRFYYHNGLWARRLWMGDDYEMQLSAADLSPDGTHIVFIHRGIFYTFPLTGGQATPLNSEPFNAYYAVRLQWSPDGRLIGFVCTQKLDTAEICVFDVANRQIKVLTDYQTEEDYVVPYFGSWGTTNEIIVYILTTHPNAEEETDNLIKILPTATGQVDTVLDETKTNLAIGREAALAPDGKTILFSAATVGESYGNSSIYQINSDGSGLRRVVGIEGLYLGQPVWSPDERSFYANSNDFTHFKPMHFDLNGKRLPGLFFEFQRTLIAWQNIK